MPLTQEQKDQRWDEMRARVAIRVEQKRQEQWKKNEAKRLRAEKKLAASMRKLLRIIKQLEKKGFRP